MNQNKLRAIKWIFYTKVWPYWGSNSLPLGKCKDAFRFKQALLTENPHQNVNGSELHLLDFLSSVLQILDFIHMVLRLDYWSSPSNLFFILCYTAWISSILLYTSNISSILCYNSCISYIMCLHKSIRCYTQTKWRICAID